VISDELRSIILAELARIAPEIDPAAVRADEPLRDQVDVDSMDFLNFIVALHNRLAVDIPESDYAKLTSLDAIVAYLSAKLGQITR
jgi:acyl carrier protein